MIWTAIASTAAVLAAIVAIWQAWIARGARRDAEAARRDAAEDARTAGLQAERAIEAQNAIAVAVRRIGQRPEPWTVKRETNGGLFRLTNTGDRRVLVNRITLVNEQGEPAGQPTGGWIWQLPMEWPAGARESLRLDGANAREPVGRPRLTIFWRELDDDRDSPDHEWSHRFGTRGVLTA